MNDAWARKRVLITGVCGTVGRELLAQLSGAGPAEIIGIDNNETELFFLSQEYTGKPSIRLFLGDVRDASMLTRMTVGINIILHAAALKHVILCEQAPRDAVQTNIIGVQNVIDAALANCVDRVVFTSSDKAVNPTNVMGTSKLMGERLMTAANALRRGDGPVFTSTRFGNILGSRGSVIPLFARQIAVGGPVTLTDPKMTRFIMTLKEAVELTLDSVFLGRGGEVFVTKMKVVRISDMAEVMIEKLAPKFGKDPRDIKLTVMGVKAGEKLYEELVNEEETRRTLELERYFAVLPAFKSIYENIDYTYPGVIAKAGISKPYNSSVERPMPKEDLADYMATHNLLSTDI
jgi:FlaA1/EpsC-like NDP-sugar epimerase